MNMTRAMFVTVLMRLSGVEADNNVKTRFRDVKSGAWYAGAVAWAVDMGIVDGTSYFTFSPDAPITREQICKMISNFADAIGTELYPTTDAKTFKDQNKISGWAKKYVAKCQKAGIVQGKSGNVFDPQGNATRAEVATILLNYLNNHGFGGLE